jgi:hypothetical protein
MADPIPSDSLAKTFLELSAASIERWIADQRSEDFTLDFKTAPRHFERPDERKALAEAISGFANSSGGIIVWGVRAARDPDGLDVAQAAEPIADPARFLANLTNYAGNAVSPFVDGVVHRIVDGLFAATLVPEGISGPHMAGHGHGRYFKRSGSSFYRMEHFDVADMFGRRRKPALSLELRKVGSGGMILVLVTNHGRGTARSPYLSLDLPPGFRVSAYGYDGNGRFGLTNGGCAGGRCVFGGDGAAVIHPRQTVGVTVLQTTVQDINGRPNLNGQQVFGFELAAEDVDLAEGKIVLEY